MPEQIPLFPVTADEQKDLQSLYDRLAEKFGMAPAQIKLSRRKLTGGHITYGPPHRIVISAHLSVRDRVETLKHEAAHAYCFHTSGPDEAHSAKFWKVAHDFGARRRYAPDTVALTEFRKKTEIVYRCESCRALFHRQRHFRRPMLCAQCHGKGRSARLRLVRKRR